MEQFITLCRIMTCLLIFVIFFQILVCRNHFGYLWLISGCFTLCDILCAFVEYVITYCHVLPHVIPLVLQYRSFVPFSTHYHFQLVIICVVVCVTTTSSPSHLFPTRGRRNWGLFFKIALGMRFCVMYHTFSVKLHICTILTRYHALQSKF